MEFETSDPPSFSVIHYPEVQNFDGSVEVNDSKPYCTNFLVISHEVVGFCNHYYKRYAAPSVIANGHPLGILYYLTNNPETG